MKTMEDSGLRGLGGAGFPAGRKWRIVRSEKAPRLLAINIDEGEPGTFKDRYYLERDPHRFLEGAIIAAWTVQISEVYIYLRDEYAGCREILEREIEGAAGRSAVPAAADLSAARRRRLHLRRGIGDDRIDRGQARHAAAAPAVRRAGRVCSAIRRSSTTWRRSTGCARSWRRAPRWFASHGRNGRKGLRSFSVSGRVKKPGVHLAPAGITVKELIDGILRRHAAGARVLRLPAGRRVGRHPAGHRWATSRSISTRCNQYGCFIGSAAIIILSDQDKARGRGAQRDEVLRRGILRAVHAVPRRHGQGARS